MAKIHSRRSFLTDVLTKAAGGWILLGGASSFVAAACGMETKYGGPVPPGEDGGPVAKYGGPPGEDAGQVAKYGGPPTDAGAAGEDAGPVVKYGGPPMDAGEEDAGPTVKYGGNPVDAG
ncbi:MAG: hypothetical protein HY901_28875 [Deltaproteobacteria bacterium]|nr:hypothetical protein [Deltaproteobacteria bacterium]